MASEKSPRYGFEGFGDYQAEFEFAINQKPDPDSAILARTTEKVNSAAECNCGNCDDCVWKELRRLTTPKFMR